MCQFCKNTDGELTEPFVSITRNPALPVSLHLWVWNKDKKGRIWYSVDVGQHTVIDGKVKITYCPICGRNLEV